MASNISLLAKIITMGIIGILWTSGIYLTGYLVALGVKHALGW